MQCNARRDEEGRNGNARSLLWVVSGRGRSDRIARRVMNEAQNMYRTKGL